jgi:WD40 repeat protein
MARRLLPLLAACLLAALLTVPAAEAQYFGRNKVQYRTFDFQVIRTANFDVYYYPEMREAAVDAARMAERSYGRLSRILQHEFRERKPLIVYASHTDFQQTNALPFMLDESTGGVAEALKGRMILPFTGSYADFDHVLTHELVHGFQYDVIFRRGMVGEAATPFNMRLPLWFMEGMAEYLSIGRVDAHTATWLRDGVLQGYLRSIDEMSQRDDYLSYRFGQSLWQYVGSKWGDEVVGIILQKAPRLGVERAFTTTLGVSLDELNREWQAAVRSTYLAQATEFDQPDVFATRLTHHDALYDPWFLAPALSPDGSLMVYLSQRDGFSFDLWIADAATGRNARRLVESARDANMESLRYMNSGAAFSPDGRYLAFASKAGGQDALNIYDLQRRRVVKRLRFDLSGIQNPSWSPDGRRIVFTGLDGGLSDLFIADLDGRLQRLTSDRYADLLPAWSPDGRHIAFTTDRATTDLGVLTYGNMRVALIDAVTGVIDVLPHQEEGKNINAVWSPDGSSLIWVSDRSGTNDLYLFELEPRRLSRISHLLSGVIAVTPLSPVLSWSRSGSLAFTYFEKAGYNTYLVEDPLSLPRTEVPAEQRRVAAEAGQVPPGDAAAGAVGADSAVVRAVGADSAAVRLPAADSAVVRAVAAGSAAVPLPAPDGAAARAAAPDSAAVRAATSTAAGVEERGFVSSYYREPGGGFRASADAPPAQEGAAPVSIVALLDSAAASLPDAADFEFRDYRVRFTADIVGRPSVGAEVGGGYYGNGLYGGSYVALSDMLGNHNILISGSINGTLSDASVYAAYQSLKRRANYGVAAWQVPLYSYMGGGYIPMQAGGQERVVAANVFRRDVIRGAQAGASYPFSTFRRVELNVTGVGYKSELLYRGYDVLTYEPVEIDQAVGGFSYFQPQVALVFDNSLFGWTGPVYGRRYRAQASHTLGGLSFSELLVDFRNYTNWRRKVVLATRLVALTRFGDDADRFALYWGGPYYVRGYDYNSFNPTGPECTSSRNVGGEPSLSRCPARDQLVGASAAFVNSELRFPLITELQLGGLGAFPPIDAVAFFDGGLAWDGRVCRQYDYNRRDGCAPGESVAVDVVWRRQAGQDAYLVREPLFSYGVGLRINIFYAVLRLDYAFPLNRDRSGMWSLGFGPSF